MIKEIEKTWGNTDNFMNHFIEEAKEIQGSGWTWLVKDLKTKSIRIERTKDQDSPILEEHLIPVLTIDLWEHAWYPTHKKEKPKYLSEIWKVVNWKHCDDRFKAESKEIEVKKH